MIFNSQFYHCIDNTMSEQHIFWLETAFQNSVEVALQLSRSAAPQETPFVHKYEAIELLNSLLQTESRYHFITHCVLGEIYNEAQQNSDSTRSYQRALACFEQLTSIESHAFSQYLIVIYNMLALSYINREEIEQGLGCLGKATKTYQAYCETPTENVYHNRSFQAKGRTFRFFYEGGIDHEQFEDNYTLTLFYLAQAYTKQGFKNKAAQYCGLTLQRQHNTGKYELKDFVNNLTGLSEYYQGSKNFSQAQYLLMLALKVIPQGKKKKLRATVHISLGNLICQLLQFSCIRIGNQDFNEADSKLVSKEVILFKEFDQAFPQVLLSNELEGCKSLFRQANTQFKKALEVFVLDGYVTEHIEILFSQSRLYKHLSILEKSNERKVSMLQKRREMLQPLLKELNPKAYPATWQKILVQVSEIFNDLFNMKVALLGVKGFPSDEKINQSCELGKKSIGYYRQIIIALQQDKDVAKNEQYYRSVINSMINIAKATSKLMSSDRKKRVEYLKDSWKLYQQIIAYIDKEVAVQFRASFSKQVELTREMIAMMPNKIDRINFGPVSILE